MKGLFRIPNWWKNRQTAELKPASYKITCACGQPCEGLRQVTHQVLRCSRCSRELFVLPSSPLPPVASLGSAHPVSRSALATWRSKPWFWPVVAGGLTFLGAAVLIVVLVNWL